MPDDESSTRRTRQSAIGWLAVAVQFGLLTGLVLLPRGSDWPTPAWVRLLGLAILGAGLLLAAAAAMRLGAGLTPTPVPRDSTRLRTDGPFRYVRHPIYTGVLLVVLGITIRSGNLAHLLLAGTIVVFFDRKARWEERLLARRHPDYAQYAAGVPRFFPRLRPPR